MKNFMIAYWKIVGLMSLALVLHILVSVIGSYTGSEIWGEVPVSYKEPMIYMLVIAAPLAYVLQEDK